MTRDSVQLDHVHMARVHRNSNMRIDLFKYFKGGDRVSGKQCLSTVFPELSYIGQTEFSQQKTPAISKFV
jgi:hypothetical protein